MHSILAQALPELLRKLRRQHFDVGTDQYLSILDWLTIQAASGNELQKDELCAVLSGIFCTSPDDQRRFGRIFKTWYSALISTGEDEREHAEEGKQPELTWPQRVKQRPLLMLLPWIAALLISGLLLWWFFQSQPPVPLPINPPKVEGKTQEGEKEQKQAQHDRFIPPPRPANPEPVPPQVFYPLWSDVLRMLWILPVFAWLVVMFWFLSQRYQVLKRLTQEGEQPLTLDEIQLAPENYRLFDSPSLEPFWRSLRANRSLASKRLDVKQTVRNVINKSGYFEPRFRGRWQPPAYLSLLERHHAQDHAAGLAQEFLNAMRRENLEVVDFHFRGDLRYSRHVRDPGYSRGPAELASLYPAHDLMLLSEGEALAANRSSRLVPWSRVFKLWLRKWLFSPLPLWPHQELNNALAKEGFQLAPLSTPALTQMGDPKHVAATDDPRDLLPPRRFQRDPMWWLQDRGIPKKDIQAAVKELRNWMGAEGYLLLVATASYPSLRWELTFALELQLRLDPETREWRLRKLARLPWYRHAYMSDRIRFALFSHVGKKELQRISDAYQALFENKGEKQLHLPFAVPQWRKNKGQIRQAVRQARPGEPLADPVLASVIRGRRPRPLEFALPMNTLKRRIAQDWSALLRPLLLGVLLIPAMLWLNLMFWQGVGESWAKNRARAHMRAMSNPVSVDIQHLSDLSGHAQTLANELRNRGFQIGKLSVVPGGAAQKQSQLNTAEASSLNRIQHGGIDSDVLENLRIGLAYSSYNATPSTQLQPELASDQIRIELLAIPRVFQDTLLGTGPEMVKIPGGCFQMGSPETEPDRSSNEIQHRVCVEDFMLGRYEVTFAEYDAFAQETGREKPNDEGWSRGRRPVINVSWHDAVAYAEWLGSQTDETYRLPTEAEWEYATRAQSMTDFWWGDSITTDQANYNGNFSYNNSPKGEYRGKTLEVGSFESNPFGLFDVHGNVWEWTCSVFDEEYGGGEQRCAEADEEGRRVLRGGSWDSLPRWLRSAFRGDDEASMRFNDVGFRLARVVP